MDIKIITLINLMAENRHKKYAGFAELRATQPPAEVIYDPRDTSKWSLPS